MTEQGTFVDDLLVHKISDTHYFLCVNAGNQDQDFEHIRAHNRVGAQIENAGRTLFADWPSRARRRWGFCSASRACRSNRSATTILPLAKWTASTA